MSWYLIYELCNKHNWFDCGTYGQYERLRRMVSNGASFHDIVLVIWICTSGETQESIAEKLKKAMEG